MKKKNKNKIQEVKIIYQIQHLMGNTIYLIHVFKKSDIKEHGWYHVETLEDDTNKPLSVILAECLNRFGEYNIEVDSEIDDYECECCGFYWCTTTTITNTDTGKSFEVYQDGHFGYDKGCTDEELIEDWLSIGYKVEIENVE